MLNDLSPEELSYLSTTFAVTLSKDLDNESIRVLCSFFANVVGTLNLVLNQRKLLSDAKEDRRHKDEHNEHNQHNPHKD